ncbi:MAG: chemotaxis response regulator protein-glutamate methylesterase [Bryobacteraceae bacterium]
MSQKIRVLIVDDSAIVRKVLSEALAGEEDIEVVGTAPDPYVARDKILALSPDVITLDIEMPRMDGLSFLKKLMRYRPTPVIMISSLAQSSCQVVLDAMSHGAVEVLGKPGGPYSVGELRMVLANKVRAAARSKPAVPEKRPPRRTPAPGVLRKSSAVLIAIGASTGGTEAIRTVLEELPEDSPPLLVVQHIPAVFSRAFAMRLDKICKIRVKEAEDGDEVLAGRALVAPGDFHMMLRRDGPSLRVEVKSGPRICYQRPSVDVTFQTVADVIGGGALGVLLTGMGSDGANGLLKMKRAGARTIAQDEASCVVYGMPREAVLLGAADQILPLSRIATAICSAVEVHS